jgi:UDPglucose 6-dehydrogenase
MGGPKMAVIAYRRPRVQVTVVNLNAKRNAAWHDPDSGQLPVYEGTLQITWLARNSRPRYAQVGVDLEEHKLFNLILPQDSTTEVECGIVPP